MIHRVKEMVPFPPRCKEQNYLYDFNPMVGHVCCAAIAQPVIHLTEEHSMENPNVLQTRYELRLCITPGHHKGMSAARCAKVGR